MYYYFSFLHYFCGYFITCCSTNTYSKPLVPWVLIFVAQRVVSLWAAMRIFCVVGSMVEMPNNFTTCIATSTVDVTREDYSRVLGAWSFVR